MSPGSVRCKAADTPLPEHACKPGWTCFPNAVAGEFCAIELDDGSLGLSYVLLDDSTKRLVVRQLSDDVTARSERLP